MLEVSPNKPLVPTRNGEAPLLAAQRLRWALKMVRVFAFACLFIVVAVMAEQKDISKLQPTPEMIREAKKNPGGWVYAITGTYGRTMLCPQK